jgi:Na+-driven multidrug efflux pump
MGNHLLTRSKQLMLYLLHLAEWFNFVFPQASPMHKLGKLFVSLRALGAPANVVMLAIQGIFRGFKDTKTPVLYIGNY